MLGLLPVWAVAGVVSVVEAELGAGGDVLRGHDRWYEAVARVLEEPLGAVVVEAVVHLVAEGGAVVLQLHQLPGQVQPLAVHLVGVGEYFVRRVVPAFVATKLGRQSYLDTNILEIISQLYGGEEMLPRCRRPPPRPWRCPG